MNNEPEIVLDDEHELVIERVAAIDVAKASGKVCMRMPHPSRPSAVMQASVNSVPARSDVLSRTVPPTERQSRSTVAAEEARSRYLVDEFVPRRLTMTQRSRIRLVVGARR